MKNSLKRFSLYFVAMLAMVMMLAFAVNAEIVTGSYSDTYSNMSWSFDTDTGVLTVTNHATSWCQLNLGWQNTNWSAFVNSHRANVKEVYVVKASGAANISKLVADSGKGFDFPNMTKLVFANGISEWSGGATALANAAKLVTLGVEGSVVEGVIDFSFAKAAPINTVLSGLKGAKTLIIPAKDQTVALPALTSLTKVIIPAEVTSLASGFFANCTSLNTVELKGSSIAPITTAGLADSASLTIIVPKSAMKAELVAAGYTAANIEVNSVVVTGSFAETYGDFQWSLDIDSGVLTITTKKTGWVQLYLDNGNWGNFVAAHKNDVKEVYIVKASGAANISKIHTASGKNFGFPNMTKLVLCNSIGEWTGASPFSGASNLVTFVMGGEATENVIDFSNGTANPATVLNGMTGATTLIVPAKNQTAALPAMTSLTKVIIPEAAVLPSGYFANCTSLTTIEFNGTSADVIINSGLADSAALTIEVPAYEMKQALISAGYTKASIIAPEPVVVEGQSSNYANITWRFEAATGICVVTNKTNGWCELKLHSDANWKNFATEYGKLVKELQFVGTKINKLSLEYWNTGSSFGYRMPNLTKITMENATGEFNGPLFLNASSLVTYGVVGSVVEGTVDLSSVGALSDSTDLLKNCSAMTKIVLPTNANVAMTLTGCTALKEVTIPAAVTSITNGAFAACTALTTVNLEGESAAALTSSGLSDSASLTINVKYLAVKEALVAAGYTKATINSEEAAPAIVEGSYSDGNTTMSWSFDPVTGVCTITSSHKAWTQLNLGWQNTNWSAFHNKYSNAVTEIVIVKAEGASNVSKIVSDSGRGFGFPNLTKITLTNKVTEWTGAETFANAKNLVTLGVSGSVTEGVIDFSFGTATNINTVLTGLKGAKTLILPAKNQTAVLPAMTALETVIIPEAVTSLASGFFANCTAIKNIEVLGDTADAVITSGIADSASLTITVATFEAKKALIAAGYDSCNIISPAARAVSFEGYSVRVKDYNGLRSIFSFHMSALEDNNNYTLVEYGTLLASASNRALYGTELDVNDLSAPKGTIKYAIYKDGKIVANILNTSTEDRIDFAVTIVNFSAEQMSKDVYVSTYEIWQNAEGEYSIFYTDYATADDHDDSYVETSLYEVSLGMYKQGALNAATDNENIVWNTLTTAGAVTFTAGTDYTYDENANYYDKNGNTVDYSETMTAVEIPMVTTTVGENSVAFTKSGVTYTLLRDGENFVVVYRGTGLIPKTMRYGGKVCAQYETNWYSGTGKAVPTDRPQPVFTSNSVAFNKMTYAIIDSGVTGVDYEGFASTQFGTVVYAPTFKTMAQGAFMGGALQTMFMAGTEMKTGFVDLGNLTSVVTSYTFKNNKFSEIHLPASVDTIGAEAFALVSSLKTLWCGNGEREEGILNFKDSALTTIAGSSLTAVSKSKVTKIILPDTCAQIASSAFTASSVSGIVVYQETMYNLDIKAQVEAFGMTYSFDNEATYALQCL